MVRSRHGAWSEDYRRLPGIGERRHSAPRLLCWRSIDSRLQFVGRLVRTYPAMTATERSCQRIDRRPAKTARAWELPATSRDGTAVALLARGPASHKNQ